MTSTSDRATTITIGSSSFIDFALWILLQSGLHVPPFDKHTGGDRILQSLGMTPESWYQWLKLILIRYDNRLCWHVPNIDTQAKENTESFKNLINIASEAHHVQHDIVFDQDWYNPGFYIFILEIMEDFYR